MINSSVFRLFFVFVFSITWLFSMSFVHADEQATIWKRLQSGGLVVLMRHASVDMGSANALLRDESCKKELNLSELGKQQATRAGELFALNNIPVEQVLASPYCRTMQTAKMAFQRAEATDFLFLLEALPADQASQASATLSQKIAAYKGKGNLVLVTHRPNIEAVSFETVEKAAFLVLEPAGDEEFNLLGKVQIQ